jgi:hypothetical protein
MTLNLYRQQMGDVTVFPFQTILCVYLLDTLLKTGELSLDEGSMLLQTFAEHFKKFEGKNCELIVTRKMGVSSVMLVASPGDIHFDNGVKIVVRLDMAGCMEELMLKLK